MAFRAAGISAGPAWPAALAAFFASGSAWAAAVFAIATVAGSALGPGRAEFIHAEVSVAIRIELGEDCRGIGDLHRVDDSVTVGVESGDHRGDRASATFWPRAAVATVARSRVLWMSFMMCVGCVFCFVLGGWSALVSTSRNTRRVKG